MRVCGRPQLGPAPENCSPWKQGKQGQLSGEPRMGGSCTPSRVGHHPSCLLRYILGSVAPGVLPHRDALLDRQTDMPRRPAIPPHPAHASCLQRLVLPHWPCEVTSQQEALPPPRLLPGGLLGSKNQAHTQHCLPSTTPLFPLPHNVNPPSPAWGPTAWHSPPGEQKNRAYGSPHPKTEAHSGPSEEAGTGVP